MVIYRKLYKKEHGLDEQTIEARIAEEWFVDGWVQYLGNWIFEPLKPISEAILDFFEAISLGQSIL